VKANFDDPGSAAVASEFVGTSITSESWKQEIIEGMKPNNPHVLLADATKHGYVVMELNEKRLKAELRNIDNEKTRDSSISTLASFVVEAGSPVIRRA
jgi:alkaline phosphatase D